MGTKSSGNSTLVVLLVIGGVLLLGSCVGLSVIGLVGFFVLSLGTNASQNFNTISTAIQNPNPNNFQTKTVGPPSFNVPSFGPFTQPSFRSPSSPIYSSPPTTFPSAGTPFTSKEPPKPVVKPLILPPLPEPLLITPSPVSAERGYPLPGEAGPIRVAGGGRFLLIHFKKLRKVGLFDTSSAKIERYLDLSEDDAYIAGAMRSMVVLLPGAGILQRYNLLTGEREFSSKIDLGGKRIEAFCMGHSSAGPLLICTEGNGGKLYDLSSFQQMKLPVATTNWGTSYEKSLSSGNYWAGGTGRVFGHSGNYGMPNGIKTWVYEGGDYNQYGEHSGSWYVMPGPDDQHIYVGGHGVKTNKVKTVANVAYSGTENSGYASHFYLPATHGPFYLHAQTIDDSFRGNPTTVPVGQIRLFMLGNSEPLKIFKDTVVTPYNDWSSIRGVGLENSIQLIPKAKLLVVVPKGCMELRLYPVNLEQLLEESDRSYFYVTSEAPKLFWNERTIRYPIQVLGKKPVTFKLESGPVGMKVTPDGTVTWTPAADFAEQRVDVILAMKDGKGQEAFHTFTIERDPSSVKK
jgi:hypothetical protein